MDVHDIWRVAEMPVWETDKITWGSRYRQHLPASEFPRRQVLVLLSIKKQNPYDFVNIISFLKVIYYLSLVLMLCMRESLAGYMKYYETCSMYF